MDKSNKAYNFFQLVLGIVGITGCILYGRPDIFSIEKKEVFSVNPLIESYNYRRHNGKSLTQTLSIAEEAEDGYYGNESYYGKGIITDQYEYESYPVQIEEKVEKEETVVEKINDTEKIEENALQTTLANHIVNYRAYEVKEYKKLLKEYYIVDPSTSTTQALFNAEKLLTMDMSVNSVSEGPQILIYHTHGTEAYIDSRKGVAEDTVVGMGEVLAAELRSYGYDVMHDETTYDYINGKSNRNYAYTSARPVISATLEKYKSIEVVIDLHRDSGSKRVTEINGCSTAQVMLFNGLCRNSAAEIKGLTNKNLQSNLAFSLQTKIVGNEMYPGLMYKIYLKDNRYNMHLAEKYMLVELGTNNNTVEEARNGVILLAEVLDRVLKNK